MDIKVEKKENNTYEATVKVPVDKVNEHFKQALEHEAEHIEIKGFRKGKAPLNVVKENIDMSKLRGHALNHLLTEAYQKVVNENKINPIVYPRFNVKKFDEGEEGEFVIILIEKPKIELGDYAKTAKELGKKNSEIKGQDIVDELVKTTKVGVASQLVDEEVSRMLSSLIDQTSRMGITVDQYLESQGKKAEQLRDDYKKVAEDTIKADFLLTEIANKEGITITDEEVSATIAAIPDEKSREALSSPEQKGYIRAVLTKSKTLDKLMEYAKPAKEADSKTNEKIVKKKEEEK